MGALADVMHEKDVNALSPEASERCLVRAHDAFVCVVEAWPEWQRVFEPVALVPVREARIGIEHTPDFCGYEAVGHHSQHIAQATFGKAIAVERGGIEIAYAARKGGGGRFRDFAVRSSLVKIAERSCAETQLPYNEVGRTDLSPPQGGQDAPLG